MPHPAGEEGEKERAIAIQTLKKKKSLPLLRGKKERKRGRASLFAMAGGERGAQKGRGNLFIKGEKRKKQTSCLLIFRKGGTGFHHDFLSQEKK